jgi:hypothetical protein
MNHSIQTIIIGGGPTGLTLAYLLGKLGKKCILIDKNSTIGGCHRVNRVDGLFAEHGPRIYSKSYVNTIALLKEMGWDWDAIFTKYDFSISTLSGQSISNFTTKEILILTFEFIKLFLGIKSSKNISVKNFAIHNNFSKKAQDYLDRICRLTDGAGSDRYTLLEFLSLINQQAFYRLYQPRLPNDEGLFKIWEEKILQTGNVEIIYNADVLKIKEEQNKIKSIIIKLKEGTTQLFAEKFIFCIPPLPFRNILLSSSKELKSTYPDFSLFTERNTYNTYTPVTFHFNKKIKLNEVWGFPSTEWGIAFIVLSNYMYFKETESKTVISTCVTIQDVKSEFTGKTANQTTNKDELIQEIFRQLKISFPELPIPTVSIMNPGVYYVDGKWFEKDTAYVETYFQEFIPPQNPTFNNLYFVGTQNGNSIYRFTSMESAVTNALATLHLLYPFTKKTHPIRSPVTLIFVLRIILIIFIIFLILLFLKKQNKRKKKLINFKF